jgi:hypothetical protein
VATVTRSAELLRLDRDTWARYHGTGTLISASLVSLGAYVVFAFDRFGFAAFSEPRSSVRLVLIGFYGWLWLAGALWLSGRIVGAGDIPFELVFRLIGLVHLPLLIVAIMIQIFAMLLRILGPSLAVGLFSVIFWLPALLVAATRQAFDVDARLAIVLVGGPYVVWLLVVGRILNDQLGHLL